MITALSLLTVLIAGMFVATVFAAVAASDEYQVHRVYLDGKGNEKTYRSVPARNYRR